MIIVFVLLFILLLTYAYYIISLSFGYKKIKQTTADKYSSSKVGFTIIVPFRNEAQNLNHLLNCFSRLDYPLSLFEVILIDDASTDGFVCRQYDFNVSVIKNEVKSKSPKKDAITKGISFANFDWIITTDADCMVTENWLNSFSQFIKDNNQVKMISGMVFSKSNGTFLDDFQQLDFMSLQAATVGSFGVRKPFMCNGANFAYKKHLFFDLNGFEGNNNQVSGDDVFLLQKALKNNSSEVACLASSDSIVFTRAHDSWSELFYQRVRWASKTNGYLYLYPKVLAIIVFLTNLGFVISIFLVFFSSAFVLFILSKVFLDYCLIFKTRSYVSRVKLISFLKSQMIYPFFSVTIGIYILCNGKYNWKDRRF